ncbi:hypothetical protein EYF80_041302 [Liparis tanakae]|uniref:Uncharacterized protein n=1 Tax=Liparis tanakae TaxID=230148 RepID=A0A4Z2G6U5_9TELE|nr:hypothetical protein EYF80_041302 [Liparis tanakae]
MSDEAETCFLEESALFGRARRPPFPSSEASLQLRRRVVVLVSQRLGRGLGGGHSSNSWDPPPPSLLHPVSSTQSPPPSLLHPVSSASALLLFHQMIAATPFCTTTTSVWSPGGF